MQPPRSRLWFLVAALALTAGLAIQATGTGAAAPTPRPKSPAKASAISRARAPRSWGPVITAAGDIALRNHPGPAQTATAQLIGRLRPTAVLTLGDNQYPRGELSDFQTSYGPTWGRFKAKTFPSLGNHDHDTPGARGYFSYFGTRAHGSGWYAYRLGPWRMIALDSILGEGVPAAELRWLRHELKTHHRPCQLAYFHHPRFSSGSEHGSNPVMGSFWKLLQRAGVDVVLNGHDHDYERFTRLLPSGRPSPKGIREFVVGTGGATLRGFRHRIERGSQVRRVVNGVLRMQLLQGSYTWRFIRSGGTVLDSGSTGCH